jgi:hypothetical protein
MQPDLFRWIKLSEMGVYSLGPRNSKIPHQALLVQRRYQQRLSYVLSCGHKQPGAYKASHYSPSFGGPSGPSATRSISIAWNACLLEGTFAQPPEAYVARVVAMPTCHSFSSCVLAPHAAIEIQRSAGTCRALAIFSRSASDNPWPRLMASFTFNAAHRGKNLA